MPIPSPFHPRTQALCESYRWKDWAGYYAVCRYEDCAEREYNAIRQAAGLMDATPLFKYDVTGPDAGRFLARILVRNVAKMKVGRMTYLCWCNDDGHMLDDGTCARLARQHFRVTSTQPAYYWFIEHAGPYRVEIEDVTDDIGALALQGPLSREVLRQVCDSDMDKLKFFAVTRTQFAGFPGWISRTGYTGDLGYELWVDNEHALALWDLLMERGRPYGLRATGLDALDSTRIEAGFMLNSNDYISARDALIPAQKSTPFEMGLGWTVKLKNRKEPFIGQAALEAEQARGPAWAFVGLVLDWPSIERLYAEQDLPVMICTEAWRDAIPIYDGGGRQVGRATSGVWSPILKKYLVLASVEACFGHAGTELNMELTVQWERRTVPARVVPTPFFDPERKRS